MSTLELKKELYKFIDKGDEQFISTFYKMATSYLDQLQKDKMIAEGEEDIKAEKTYTIDEAKKMVQNWKH